MKRTFVSVIVSLLLTSALATTALAQGMGQGRGNTAPYDGPRPSGVLPLQQRVTQIPVPTSTEPVPTMQPNQIITKPYNYLAGDMVILEADEIVNKDFFAAGETVRILGTVNGDLYVAGGDIVVQGTIQGDILVAGGTVRVEGNHAGDIRAVGGAVTIDGVVGGNVSLVGGSLTATSGSVIGGNLAMAGGTVQLDGQVQGNVTGVSSDATLTGTVQGDVDLGGEKITVADTAKIGGKLTEFSFADMADQAEKEPASERPEANDFFAVFNIMSFLSSLVVGLLFVYVAPYFMRATADTLQTRPWKSLGIGLLVIFLAPLTAILLMITVIGIPLGALTFALFGITMYFSSFFVMYWMGQFIAGKMQKTWHDGVVFGVGLLAFTLLAMIPVAGFILRMLAVLMGAGALLLTKKDLFKTLKAKKLV